jgi:hypothetical protein
MHWPPLDARPSGDLALGKMALSLWMVPFVQTYWDLLCLEKRLGLAQRYLTSEAEDVAWAPQLKMLGLLKPAAVQQQSTVDMDTGENNGNNSKQPIVDLISC